MAQEIQPRRAHGQKRAVKATRQVRFDARMSPELKMLLQRAADLGDETLSAFVLSSAREAATRRIREHDVLTLSVRDSERFVESLRHPPEPNDFMADAARQHAALIESWRVVSAPYRVEPLGDHERWSFTCGKESLDRYLRQQAGQDVRRNLARVYVLVEVATGTVAGYYSLSSYSIEAAALPTDIARRFGRYNVVPATLIGRLALDHRYQGRKLGKVLLRDALKKSLDASNGVASCGVVVDALDDDARGFYERAGFIRFLDNEYKLFLPMGTIGKLP